MGKFFLVIGGCRSGKSSFAVEQAMKFEERYYLATAQAYDKEMLIRIQRHQNERNQQFITIEEPLKPYLHIPKLDSHGVLVLDCLTLWISNLLMLDLSDHDILKEVDTLINALQSHDITSYIVSNEVGMGIVPENKLSRRFRDLVGWSHQNLCQRASEVYQLSFGIPLPLKTISKEFSHGRY